MVARTIRDESELLIFSRFSRALVHVVRGDLSVITNEVSYLATQMPSEELGRVRNRCSQMAATISKIAGLHSELSLTVVGSEAIARSFGALVSSGDLGSIAVDIIKLERLASSIRQMLPMVDTAWTARRNGSQGLLLSLVVPGHAGQSVRYVTWSKFASQELGERSVIDAVVADLIMRAHGWKLDIQSSPVGLHITLRMQFVSEHLREPQCV